MLGLISLALLGAAVFAEDEAPVRLRLQLERTEPYCGGAEPAEDELRTTHPYTGVLHVRPGERNSDAPVLAELHPDEQGRVQLELPAPGRYCLVSEDKLQDSETWVQARVDRWPAYQHNETCHAQHWTHCTSILDTEQAAKGELTLTIHGRCGWEMPCVIDAPAPPPSAAPGG